MLTVRKANDRGSADHGWLKTSHTFSFSTYHDPKHIHFRTLRVMNEDWVAPGEGFGTHPHKDMEIVTYVLEGALEHRDSMGNGEILRPGEFQRMTAGTGITHSEFNPSSDEPVHLYQIWIFPEEKGLEPSYEQKSFDDELMRNQLLLVASRAQQGDSLKIHQDAEIFLSRLDPGQSVTHPIAAGRHVWLQVLRGNVSLNGEELEAGDGVAVSDEVSLSIHSSDSSEILLFDLA
ncbi:Quercetin 2,3-dioxygenase [Thalassoglobus neptunius]|uniref:Quercetin 2,3-dioxygenase n=1 Tax=Thalassoglobus neptunius TaxID=1938619 RepID=A0A5C5W868_9PLAN|nr:pirin family protein [Thalassoglobus neptunius]TWT47086.1 Quercetin 2,3-dioxygenase [Thalassoglobus neptunius]